MRRALVGFDSGADAGLALLLDDGGPRPTLVDSWEIFGAPHLWFPRCRAAVEACWLATAALEADEVLCWVEDWDPNPPGGNRNRRKSIEWAVLGRWQGAFMAHWVPLAGQVPTLVPVANERQGKRKAARMGWATLLGVPGGKVDDGIHRHREAALHVAGPVTQHLARVNALKRRGDVAEAMLIAAAAGLHARSVAVQARMALAAR